MNNEIKTKSLSRMTRKEIENVPSREWSEDIGEFDALVILPTRDIHDSGYRCMDFVACVGDTPIRRLSGCSDVIHINGIGGYGKWKGLLPQLVEPIDWSIDCLKVSGLLRMFSQHKLTCGTALSSFEIYATKKITTKPIL